MAEETKEVMKMSPVAFFVAFLVVIVIAAFAFTRLQVSLKPKQNP